MQDLINDFKLAIDTKNAPLATTKYEELCKMAPTGSYMITLMNAKLNRVKGNTNESNSLLKELIKKEPSNVEAYLESCRCIYDKKGKWVDYMSNLAKTFKGSKELYQEFYKMLIEDTRVQKKEALLLYCLEQLHVLDPYNPVWLIELAKLNNNREVQLELYCRSFLLDKSQETLKSIQTVIYIHLVVERY